PSASRVSNAETAPDSSSRIAAISSAASAPSASAVMRNRPVADEVAKWVPAFAETRLDSGALDKGVHDLLVAGMLEIDVEPVVLDLADCAVAEFLVKHAVADREAADLWHFLAAQWHARAFDQQRLAAGAAHLRLVPGAAPAGRRGGPAWRRRRAGAESRPHTQPEFGDDLDMVRR